MLLKFFRISVFFVLSLLLSSFENISAQTGYTSDPTDVGSVDSIVKAAYDSISGEKGIERNWDRFKSLFLKDAKLTAVRTDSTGQLYLFTLTVDEFIDRASPLYIKSGFFEIETFAIDERFNHIAHRFSTYEARWNKDDEKPLGRGINSFQLYFDDERWWIQSIFWEYESEQNPIPDKYLP